MITVFQSSRAFAQYEALKKRHELILWFALLALAALVRFGPVPAGLPYISYVDEGYVLHPAMEILKARSFDSTRFTYPPLTSYLTIAAAAAYGPIYRLVHHRSLRNDLPRHEDFQTALGENYDLITPPEIIWLGRGIVACLSLGVVVLAGALGKRAGGERVGFLAMLFAALCPALVSRGSIAIIDATAAFFVLLALYFCERLRAASHWWYAGLGGIAAGLAFGAKYTVGVVFAAVLLTIATLAIDRKSKGLVALAAIVGLVIGIFCGVPAAVLHPAKIVNELRTQAAFYQSIQSEQTYAGAALSASELGIPLIIAGIAGLLWMLGKRKTRLEASTWLVFAALLLALIIWPRFQPFRNVLSLVPFFCIGAAFFFDQIWIHFQQRRIKIPALVAVAGLLLFTAPLAWFTGLYLKARLGHVDSRVRAVDWLRQHVSPETTVLGLRELAILPAEWQRVPAKTKVVSWFEAADLLRQERFDYLVTGEFDLRYATDAARWKEYQERWRGLVAELPQEAEFGVVVTPVVPYLWRTNDERIVIRKPL
ncbi:MAG: ArnT family glycosyltransferase [Chthoniobacterales bacterium]